MTLALQELVGTRLAGRARRIRRKPRQAPDAREPSGPRMRFERELRKLISQAQSFINQRIKKALPDIVRQQQEVIRQDAPSDEIRRILEELEREIGLIFNRGRLRRLAEQMVADVNVHTERQVGRQVRALLGIDIFAASPDLFEVLQSSLDEAVDAVQKWSTNFAADVSGTVRRGVRRGLRSSDIARELNERSGIGIRRARLIARDQVANANAALTRQRHRDAGISRYRWVTSLDERVRDEHADRHGQIYSWDNPPADGHPGEPIQCRCTATPVLE